MSVEDAIKEIVASVVDERLAALPRSRPSAAPDEETQAMIRQLEIVAVKPYLNKKELMLYLDCSDRSIEEWSQRPLDKNPLPVVRAGRDLRIKREKADEWMEREGERFWRLKALQQAS